MMIIMNVEASPAQVDTVVARIKANGFKPLVLNGEERTVIAVVGNDAGWTQIAREQVKLLGDDVGTVLAHSDYDRAAEGLGAAGFRLDDPERAPEVLAAARAAAADGKPAAIPGGRLVLPVGSMRAQELVRVTKSSHGVELERLGPCAFVPLIAREAWPASSPR